MKQAITSLFAAALLTPAASGGIILDSFTTATGGTGNSVQNNDPADGCNGPSTANHNGTMIMGGSGTRNMSISRTSGAQTRCVQALVDQATTFNDLQMNSDPNTSGTLTLSGSGSNYSWLAGDTAVTFLASHDLLASVTATAQVFLHVSGGGYIGAAPVTINSGALTLHTINMAQFTIGGTLLPGTVLDGYQLILNGGLGSDLVVDELSIVSDTGNSIPEPSVAAITGLGLAIIAARKRSRPWRSWAREQHEKLAAKAKQD